MNQVNDIKYIVIDVDGTMTDAGIYYDEHGNELKKFCTKDAAGFFAARQAGIKIVVLTGRECAATTRRMQEMKVDYLVQNIKDKKTYLAEFMKKYSISKDQIAYIGDDLNDLSSMMLCGYVACPKDACPEIKEIADYISMFDGGKGVIRDVVENIFRKTDKWRELVQNIYGIGV